MNKVPSDISLPYEVTLSTGLLFVAMKVRDLSAGSPGTLVATVPMTENAPGLYEGFFTGSNGKSYGMQKAEYTNGNYNVLAGGPTASETIYCSAEPDVASLLTSILAMIRASTLGKMKGTLLLSGAVNKNKLLKGIIVKEC